MCAVGLCGEQSRSFSGLILFRLQLCCATGANDHDGLCFSSTTEGLVGKDLGARLFGELSWAVDQLEPVLQGTLSVPVVCNPPRRRCRTSSVPRHDRQMG